MAEGLRITRRNLPHWRLEGSAYFVTWRLAPQQALLSEPERDLVAAAIRHFHESRYKLYCFVVMDDHAHAVIAPRESYTLGSILHSWKSYTAHKLVQEFGRNAPVWLDESFDRIIRDEAELLEKANYILTNPQRCWPELSDYRWAEWLEG
jgi:putative transposase